jgi:XRE family transcriptional regulator, regulator of sulfur utilization
MTLGERLRELRIYSGFTLMQLSSLCYCSHTYLSEMERDIRYPSLTVLFSIAQAYRMSVGEVLLDVEGWGEITEKALAPGLLELCQDAEIGNEITSSWISLLSKIELDGIRPQTKREWLEVYLYLRRLLVK